MSTLSRSIVRSVITFAFFAAAIVGYDLWIYDRDHPAPRDAGIRAEIVGVEPDTSSLVANVLVGNQIVHRGDVVDGYFEETKLAHIHAGDPVRIDLLGEEAILIGHVESNASNIAVRGLSAGSGLPSNINATIPSTRSAERLPVRIAVDAAPESVKLIPGSAVTVSIGPEASSSYIGRVIAHLYAALCCAPPVCLQ